MRSGSARRTRGSPLTAAIAASVSSAVWLDSGAGGWRAAAARSRRFQHPQATASAMRRSGRSGSRPSAARRLAAPPRSSPGPGAAASDPAAARRAAARHQLTTGRSFRRRREHGRGRNIRQAARRTWRGTGGALSPTSPPPGRAPGPRARLRGTRAHLERRAAYRKARDSGRPILVPILAAQSDRSF